MVVNVKDLNAKDYTHVSQLEEGKVYEQIFHVAGVDHNLGMVAGNGTAFAQILLSDVSGEVNLVIWGFTKGLVEIGDFARIRAEVKVFKGERQLTCQSFNVTKIDRTPENFYDYFAGVTDSQLDSYALELQETLEYLTDDDYRTFSCVAIHNYNIIKLLRQSPFGLRGPLAYRGGLLVHVVHSIRLARAACNQARILEPNINESLVLMACAFRQLGYCTTTEFVDGTLTEKDSYRLNGIEKSTFAILTQIFSSNRECISPEKYNALVNCCNYTDILVLEGKIADNCALLAKTIDFGVFKLSNIKNQHWVNNYYVGHLCE